MPVRNKVRGIRAAAAAAAIVVAGVGAETVRRATAAGPSTAPVGVVGPAPVAVAATRASPPRSAAVLKLQREQVDALREATELARQLFQRGLGPVEDVNRLSRKLMETRLRIAATPAERAGVLADALAAAKGQDELLAQMFKAGLTNDMVVQEAKAYRLSIEELICVEQGK